LIVNTKQLDTVPANSIDDFATQSLVARGDELRKSGQLEQAIDLYLTAAKAMDPPTASVCLRLARSYERLRKPQIACRWALAVVDAGDDFASWETASALLQRCGLDSGIAERRSARVALTGSFTTTQLARMLTLAARRIGIRLEIYESPYGQYEQEVIDPHSPLYAFAPHFIVLAVHEGDLRLPQYSDAPEQEIEAEVGRWTKLWQTVAKNSTMRLIQCNFALPSEAPMGHLGARLPGSRYMMMQAVNAQMGERARNSVSLVDCERLSALFGKQRWFDPRYWYLGKQAVALGALPLLARHTASVMAADLGLTRKCLVLDLDNTLWGGVVAEDGLSGISLGNGVDGEAFAAFQDYVCKLKQKGVLLAVCSKNNEADAKEPFEKHPEMRLKLDDIAMFVANWRSKPDNLRTIAETLDLGLDSLVLVDDNPAERAAVRQFLPEVDVIPLPADPAYYTRTLSEYLLFETSSFTPEDVARTGQYRSRAQIMELKASATNLDDFYRSLGMKAIVAPFDDFHLPRIAQLVGKTNQFNVTTRRHGIPQLEAFLKDANCVHFYLRLRDRFADHGLVGLMLALRRARTLEIDTWLMSCRVLGRTVEATMLQHLFERAEELGCTSVRGVFIPTAKNALAKDVFAKFGFELVGDSGGSCVWQYDLRVKPPIKNQFIEMVHRSEATNRSTQTT
jgi:FkbH-like protein